MAELVPDMQRTERIVRGKAVLRVLACPQCGNVEPGGGVPVTKFYACICGWEYESLAELRATDLARSQTPRVDQEAVSQ